MLTPQEVSTHVFSKARMGGYNMAMVDEFLDTLTEDYTTLYKENAALKAKLKVLVDKVEEYRATEDSMRATLLTAQKMARPKRKRPTCSPPPKAKWAHAKLLWKRRSPPKASGCVWQRKKAPHLLPICAACAAASWNFSTVYPKSR